MSEERKLEAVVIPIAAMDACMRLMDGEDHYPGLKFAGNHDSYEKLRQDINLVAETLAKILLESKTIGIPSAEN
jgi:hypothetical protein